MKTLPARLAPVALLLVLSACGTRAFSPGQPGSSLVDVSSEVSRIAWIEARPDVADDIREAVLEGVFVPGMTPEHVRVITNPERAGVAGRAYWRHFVRAEELRYRWYVSGERVPFMDGKQRGVCELVFRADRLLDVRYCGGEAETGGESGGVGSGP